MAIKKWISVWKARRKREVLEIESNLSRLLSNEDGDPLSSAQLEEIKSLEERRNAWLRKDEQEWRLKSHALWLQVGDNNTKFFHHFSNHRRNLNTIWEIKNEEGVKVNSFKKNLR
jgi:hypothetical protein